MGSAILDGCFQARSAKPAKPAEPSGSLHSPSLQHFEWLVGIGSGEPPELVTDWNPWVQTRASLEASGHQFLEAHKQNTKV